VYLAVRLLNVAVGEDDEQDVVKRTQSLLRPVAQRGI
jgi:hypothetical protein